MAGCICNASCGGMHHVLQVDISQVAIQQMKEKHAGIPGLTYQLGDCRNMPEFMDCQFGSVIDKGGSVGLQIGHSLC